MKYNSNRMQLDCDRSRAAQYFSENFSREQRYLKIFARDFREYLKSGDWLRKQESRDKQKYFDFLLDFESLKEKMQEFRWSADFLKENGIDFKEIRKLYFAVA